MKKLVIKMDETEGTFVDLTAEEISAKQAEEAEWNNNAFDRSMKNLRSDRNALLKDTDYLANNDMTMSDDMKNYRQALRDITNGLTTVEQVKAVEFPTKPE